MSRFLVPGSKEERKNIRVSIDIFKLVIYNLVQLDITNKERVSLNEQ